jgi:hypothetical protein
MVRLFGHHKRLRRSGRVRPAGHRGEIVEASWGLLDFVARFSKSNDQLSFGRILDPDRVTMGGHSPKE